MTSFVSRERCKYKPNKGYKFLKVCDNGGFKDPLILRSFSNLDQNCRFVTSENVFRGNCKPQLHVRQSSHSFSLRCSPQKKHFISLPVSLSTQAQLPFSTAPGLLLPKIITKYNMFITLNFFLRYVVQNVFNSSQIIVPAGPNYFYCDVSTKGTNSLNDDYPLSIITKLYTISTNFEVYLLRNNSRNGFYNGFKTETRSTAQIVSDFIL